VTFFTQIDVININIFRTNDMEIVRNGQSYLGFNLPSDLYGQIALKSLMLNATSEGSFVKYGFTGA